MSLTFFTIPLRKVRCIEVISIRLFLGISPYEDGLFNAIWNTCWSRPFEFRTLEQTSLRCNGFIWNSYKFFHGLFRQVNVCSTHSALPALRSPLSKRFCRCAGIALQNGCQVANRVTDVCGESLIHGITSEISRQRAGCKCVCSGEH
jgi:hypothetical protein